MKELSLAEAAAHIRRTCDRHPRSFFFMVGAGISYPPVPLAPAIVEACKQEATGAQAPPGLKPIDEYSWWFQEAFHSPADRQWYLRNKLIEGKAVSPANLRLAHLLLGAKKRISNLAITTNFDDFLSRGLALFSAPHIVCDHPGTIQRINPENDDIQIVHLHGTYWFYDCCNLKGEIEDRSQRSTETVFSMADFLDRVLSNRSPLVVGYSGWENDVFMSALRSRLRAGLAYNLYWFCYERGSADALPEWLKTHENVFLVLPRPAEPAKELAVDTRAENGMALRAVAGLREAAAGKPREPVLSARDVFDELIRQFGLEAPPLTRDPLGFFAESLRSSAPPEEDAVAQPSIYSLRSVIERIEGAKRAFEELASSLETRLESVRDALRRSQYRDAVKIGSEIGQEELDTTQLGDLMEAMWTAGLGLLDNSPDELQAYELTVRTAEQLMQKAGPDERVRERMAAALVFKGLTLGQLSRREEAIQVYDQVVERFGQAPEPALRQQVAKALLYKALALFRLNRSEEEIQVYDQVVEGFGQASEPALREQVAKALVWKGITLRQLNRREEAIRVYDEVVGRFGQAPEPALREQVATALVNKGITLGQLSRTDEQIQVCDQVVERFDQAPEPELREQVANALLYKGIALGRLNRCEEEIQAFDRVVERFGQAPEPALGETVANALNNLGFRMLFEAKRVWAGGNEERARLRLAEAKGKLVAAGERVADKPVVLRNLGYAEFLLGNRGGARTLLTRALVLGGEGLRRGALEFPDIHPLPQDAEFKELVGSVPAPRTDNDSTAQPA